MDVKWNEGSKDCIKNPQPPIQVHRYNAGTFILRENLCATYEAPFIYLLIGKTKALLIDTGAVTDAKAMPLAERMSRGLSATRIREESGTSKAAPDIPTAIEAGLPGMIAGNLNGLFAPAGVSPTIVEQIAEATRKSMTDADLQRVLIASGFEPILDSGPDATRQFISDELKRWTPIMKATGFKME